MDYKVEVDFAPMYECVSSMTAFLSKQNHTAMDSGKLWVRDVQARFAPMLLRKMQEVVKKLDDFSLAPYIWSCPGERSVESFLVWFDALTSGELYEISGRFGQSVPSNLAELRDTASDILREWNAGYFSGIDPNIIKGLEQEAESRRKTLNGSNDMEVFEAATDGMRLYPTDHLKQVIIIPQYHARPLVTTSMYDEFVFTSYSCDALLRKLDGLLQHYSALPERCQMRRGCLSFVCSQANSSISQKSYVRSDFPKVQSTTILLHCAQLAWSLSIAMLRALRTAYV